MKTIILYAPLLQGMNYGIVVREPNFRVQRVIRVNTRHRLRGNKLLITSEFNGGDEACLCGRIHVNITRRSHDRRIMSLNQIHF